MEGRLSIQKTPRRDVAPPLAGHLHGVQGVASSNLVVPTNMKPALVAGFVVFSVKHIFSTTVFRVSNCVSCKGTIALNLSLSKGLISLSVRPLSKLISPHDDSLINFGI